MNTSAQPGRSGYAEVDGLRVYYEVHGRPLPAAEQIPIVLLHGGMMSIETAFAGDLLPHTGANSSSDRHRAARAWAHRRSSDRADDD